MLPARTNFHAFLGPPALVVLRCAGLALALQAVLALPVCVELRCWLLLLASAADLALDRWRCHFRALLAPVGVQPSHALLAVALHPAPNRI